MTGSHKRHPIANPTHGANFDLGASPSRAKQAPLAPRKTHASHSIIANREATSWMRGSDGFVLRTLLFRRPSEPVSRARKGSRRLSKVFRSTLL